MDSVCEISKKNRLACLAFPGEKGKTKSKYRPRFTSGKVGYTFSAIPDSERNTNENPPL